MKKVFYWLMFTVCDQIAEYYFKSLNVQPLTGADFSYNPNYKKSFMKWMERRNKWYMPGFYSLLANKD